MKRIVILISGRGSNMEAIITASRRERWPADVVGVVSTRPDAAGVAIAERAGVPVRTVDAKAFADRAGFETALGEAIDAHRPDCVVLAGFMRVLSDAFVARYADRMLNIHPSLLPAFTGLKTHERALAAGVRAHGATVHFVSPELDAGPIVAQAVVPVRDADTAPALAARVLEAEHALYPRAIRWFVSGQALLEAGRVRLSPDVTADALMVCP